MNTSSKSSSEDSLECTCARVLAVKGAHPHAVLALHARVRKSVMDFNGLFKVSVATSLWGFVEVVEP